MPQFFKENGYWTASVGKVFHSPRHEHGEVAWNEFLRFENYYLYNVAPRCCFAMPFNFMHEILYITQVIRRKLSSALFLRDQVPALADVERQFNCVSHYTYAKYY